VETNSRERVAIYSLTPKNPDSGAVLGKIFMYPAMTLQKLIAVMHWTTREDLNPAEEIEVVELYATVPYEVPVGLQALIVESAEKSYLVEYYLEND
jgi:hypothetical protein